MQPAREGSGKTLLNLIGYGHTKKLETGGPSGRDILKLSSARPLPSLAGRIIGHLDVMKFEF